MSSARPRKALISLQMFMASLYSRPARPEANFFNLLTPAGGKIIERFEVNPIQAPTAPTVPTLSPACLIAALSAADCKRLTRDVLLGLAHMHSCGWAHRDLKVREGESRMQSKGSPFTLLSLSQGVD